MADIDTDADALILNLNLILIFYIIRPACLSLRDGQADFF